MGNKLLIFDADNTLLDSSNAIYHGWLEIAKGFNKTFFKNKRHYDKIIKKHKGNWIKFSEEEFGLNKSDHNKIFEIWGENIKNIYDEYSIVYEGYKEIFSILKKQGHITAIATNNSEYIIRDSITKILGNEIIIFSETTHGENKKPEPNMILDFMDLYGFNDPKNVFMIGDEKDDLIAGTRAGVNRVLALFDSHLCPLEHRDIFDYHIKNPNDILKILEKLKL